MIDEPLKAPAVVALLIDEINHQPGIQIAAARAHHEAAGRRKPHRGVDRTPL